MTKELRHSKERRIWHCKNFFSFLCVFTALPHFAKRYFFCFSNTFGLHFRFHWVTWKETILSMQLHQVTSWPSHHTSLAVRKVSWSFPTQTSSLTSEDESHQASKNCSTFSDKHCCKYWYFPFFHAFHCMLAELCANCVILIRNPTGLHSVVPFGCDVHLHLWRLDIVLIRHRVMSPLHNCLISLML